MLDREGAEGPADVVIAGDEATVGGEPPLGARRNGFLATVAVEGDADCRSRARPVRLERLDG